MAEVIKRDEPETRQVAYFDLVNIEAMARQTLLTARRQALAMLADANRQAEAIRLQAQTDAERLGAESQQRGRQEGLVQGREQGRQEALKLTAAELAEQTASTRQTVAAMAERLRDQGRILHEQARAGLVRLACAIARRVVKKAVQSDGALAERTLEQAIELAADHGHVTVRVHPLDAEAIRQFLSGVVSTLGGLGDWDIAGDESVGRGGCVIHSQRGELDARLATQLDRIERELLHDGDGAPADGRSQVTCTTGPPACQADA